MCRHQFIDGSMSRLRRSITGTGIRGHMCPAVLAVNDSQRVSRTGCSRRIRLRTALGLYRKKERNEVG